MEMKNMYHEIRHIEVRKGRKSTEKNELFMGYWIKQLEERNSLENKKKRIENDRA